MRVARTLIVLVLIAGLAGGCGDPGYTSYLVNQQPEDVLVVFDGQSDGATWTQRYVVPGLSEGWVSRGPGSLAAKIVVYRQRDCVVLGRATLEFGQLLITVPGTGPVVFQTGANVLSWSGPFEPLQASDSSVCSV